MALEIIDNRWSDSLRFEELSSGDFFMCDGKVHIMTAIEDSATCLEDGIHYAIPRSTIVVRLGRVKLTLE